MDEGRSRSDYSVGVLKDGDGKKRHPNSIVAVIRGVISHWSNSEEPRSSRSKASSKRFLKSSNFKEVYYRTLSRFDGIKNASGRANKGHDDKETENIAGMLDGLGAESKQTAIEYYHIRAFADFVGISDSAFLSFSKLCSLERRAKNSDEFLELADEYIRAEREFLLKLHQTIHSGDFDGFTFQSGKHRKTGHPIWIADVGHLRRAATSFGFAATSKYRSAMSRK